MKNILKGLVPVIVYLLLLPMFAAAQTDSTVNDSYYDAFIRYETQYGVGRMSPKQFSGSLQVLNVLIRDTAIGPAIEEYTDQYLMQDLLQVLEPSFREKIAEDDFLSLIAWAEEHPQYDSALAKEREILDSDEYKMILGNVMKDLFKISEGMTTDRVKADKSVKRSYRNAFDAYWKICYPRTIVNNSLSVDFSKAESDEARKKMEDFVNSFADYIDGPLRLRMMNLYADKGCTQADLLLIAENNSSSQYQRVSAALLEAIGNGEAIGEVVLKSFMRFFEKMSQPQISRLKERETTINTDNQP